MSRDDIKHTVKHLVMKRGMTRTEQLKSLRKFSKNDLYSFLKELIEKVEPNNEVMAHNAAELIAILIPDIGLNLLLDNLANSYMPLRWDIVLLLGDIGDKGAIPHLITVLLEDASPEVRIQATLSLGKLGGHEALEALKKVVNKDFGEDYEGRTVSECAKNEIEEILAREKSS